MKRFLDLLRSPKPSSAELRTAIAENDVEAAQAEHARLNAQHAELLMEGDDKTLDALEARISAARRQVERVTIVRDQLHASLAEAEAREAAEILTAERGAAEAEAEAVAKVLRTTYPKMVADMVAVLARLEASEQAVRDVNAKLLKAERGDELVAEVETRTFPLAPHTYGPAMSIGNRTRLPAIDGITGGHLDPLAEQTYTGHLPLNAPLTKPVPAEFGSIVLPNTTPRGSFVGLDR